MRRHHIIIGGVVLLLSVALLSAAAYLLHYALQPEREAVAETWARLYREYPDTRPWHDSLVHCHALRDTTITAKDGTHLHAFYVRNPRSQGRTAVLVHGYTDNAVRMMHLGRMYERDLGYNILNPILRFFGASDATLPFSHEYMLILLSFNAVTHLYFGLNAMLRSTNRPRIIA